MGSKLVLYAAPALAVSGLLLLLVAVQGNVEAAASGVAGTIPLGYAFAAGMVASVNPCGFILLPSYISFQLGTEEDGYYQRPGLYRAAEALALGLLATAAFVLVFAAAGLVLAAGGQWLAAVFPEAGVVVGLAMAGLGVWLLVSRRTLIIGAATRVAVTPRRNLAGAFLFGLAYAAGSLGCTLPVFLVVVGGAVSARNVADGVSQFLGYSLGMGTVLVAVSLGAALAKGAVGRNLRRAVPHVHRASALFLIGAGLYLIYYWAIYARY
jgi:cytochrome c-type biogenesis protein